MIRAAGTPHFMRRLRVDGVVVDLMTAACIPGLLAVRVGAAARRCTLYTFVIQTLGVRCIPVKALLASDAVWRGDFA
ncbi:hypothetical protein AAU01_28880 [Paenarthrobacter aurescens]|uniref:Uncharacterized protein n=1 Tax=Paenarthrobacter aurescens TaxID=43663 RepID=A0A4Y3NFU5_PAEAU|nr:hypothetical protein AAU01_28880 [Paenarthrobacter aurescens]